MSMLSALVWASLLSYTTALVLLWQYTTQTGKHTAMMRSSIIIATLIGLILHAFDLYIRVFHTLDPDTGLVFALGHSISLVAVVATLVFVLLSMVRATLNLGLAILPTSIIGVLAGLWLNPSVEVNTISSLSFQWHIALGVIAFGLLSLAFAQSLLVLIQDRQLKSHHQPNSGFSFISLPALQSMETLLFQLLWLGFAVLSVTLFVGVFLNKGEHGAALSFNHHTILTLLAWLTYLVLLVGRRLWGWRGRQASIYTIICYSLFLLGYFGPRIVRELIIN